MLVELNLLSAQSDYITLHIPKTPGTAHIINRKALSKMKPTVRIVNCARVEIIDENALAEAIIEKRIAGAALDVFEKEPLNNSKLISLNNIILTPRLETCTVEAQVNVAVDVAERIRDVLLGLPARTAVNIPRFAPDVIEKMHPYLQLAETLGNLAGQLAGGRIEKLTIRRQGELTAVQSQPIVVTINQRSPISGSKKTYKLC